MEKPIVPKYVVELARKLRQSQTSAEEMLWECLRDRRLAGAKFRRQHPLGRYIADFYCHEGRLVVELQGGIHSLEDQRQYDAIRQEIIQQQGIKVITFSNHDVEQNLEGVLQKIADTLTPPSAILGSARPEPVEGLSLRERGRR